VDFHAHFRHCLACPGVGPSPDDAHYSYVDNIDFQFVAARYATPFWRTYDLLMLWFAMIHGVNGIRTVLVDYISPRGWRVASLASLYVLGFVVLTLGSLAILTFNAPATP